MKLNALRGSKGSGGTEWSENPVAGGDICLELEQLVELQQVT
jgi:hypothetical protein